jgi:hypothetical protein
MAQPSDAATRASHEARLAVFCARTLAKGKKGASATLHGVMSPLLLFQPDEKAVDGSAPDLLNLFDICAIFPPEASSMPPYP